MPEIKILDEQTIDKIAAGEVVERPSSVVKELVENALDAGATAVTVEIKDGGTRLIRITDNGCGIEKQQIPLAFYRHSTNKLRTVEDLLSISSLGFRGEALSSIAAVAQVELITKTREALTGSRYLIEGGKECGLEEIGAPSGTTFLVKNLFFNTPARRKFLKAPQTEAGYISDLMDRMALSHPEVSFKFINNGQNRLHTSGNGRLKDIIYHIYGRDIAANLIEVHGEFEGFSVDGYVGKPVISRGNRNFESYFINGRYIKSPLIAKSIEDAYHGFLMQHKYPFAVLSLSMDGSLIDVNVHPNKMELRFSGEEEIYNQLVGLIQDALRERELITRVSVKEERSDRRADAAKREEKAALPEPFERERLARLRAAVAKDSPYEQKYPSRAAGAGSTKQPSADIPSISSEAKTPPAVRELSCYGEEKLSFALDTQAREELFFPPSKQTESNEPCCDQTDKKNTQEELRLLSEAAKPKRRIIGQLFDTYWLVELQDQFYMIDQHAAHEKILFEQTMRAYETKDFTSQRISPPILLSLTMQEELLLKRYLTEFSRLGFEIEPFGGKEYAVSAVPANLYGIDGQELLLELIDELGGLSEQDAPQLVLEKVASMSCKAAVKGRDHLSFEEAASLIDELLTLENPYFCPHGRPVIIAMSKQEIEKKFKRIV